MVAWWTVMERGKSSLPSFSINFPPSMEGKKKGWGEVVVKEKEEKENQWRTEIVYAFSGGVASGMPRNPLFPPYFFWFSI